MKIGAWEDGKFVGVVVFGVGATRALLAPYGLTPEQGCELVRIAFKKHETPISRIIALSLGFLRKHCPKLRLVVSFADPAQGHHGGVYQGSNWVYAGRSEDCKYPIVNGTVIHPRQMSRLVKRDGLRRDSVDYVLKPGKHRYLMPLDAEMRKQIEPLRKPYPKRAVSKENVATPDQGVEGGVNPTTALHDFKSEVKNG